VSGRRESARHEIAPQERLLDACVTPARSQGRAQRCEPVDLATIAADGLRAHELGELEGLIALEPAWTSGDLDLLERLGGTRPLNAAQHALRTRGLIAFSRCLRTHGVPSFPDPNPNPNGFPYGGDAPALLDSPIGRAAFTACDSDFPKVGPQIRLG
jgi:hypothetical protein